MSIKVVSISRAIDGSPALWLKGSNTPLVFKIMKRLLLLIYARALFKYKGGAEGQDDRKSFVIDLNGVPPQPPIP